MLHSAVKFLLPQHLHLRWWSLKANFVANKLCPYPFLAKTSRLEENQQLVNVLSRDGAQAGGPAAVNLVPKQIFNV